MRVLLICSLAFWCAAVALGCNGGTSLPVPTSTATPTPKPVPTSTAIPTPVPSTATPSVAPDLVISLHSQLESSGSWGEWANGCVKERGRISYFVEIIARIENIGNATAGSFVVETDAGDRVTASGLGAGQFKNVIFRDYISQIKSVTGDADLSVHEHDESNNTAEAEYIPVPTLVPPPVCTPIPG